MRGHVKSKKLSCARPQEWLGWHLSYFMDSAMMLGKLRAWGGFLVYGSQQVSDMVYAPSKFAARKKIDGWASGCHCLYGGKPTPQPTGFALYDGRRPPLLSNLPRHPAAKQAHAFTLTELEAEAAAHARAAEAALRKQGRGHAANRTGSPWADAVGRLAAVRAEIRRRLQ